MKSVGLNFPQLAVLRLGLLFVDRPWLAGGRSLYETFAKRHFLPDFCVRLKFKSSKYSIYSCG